ncbi:hypothetical protein BDW_03275 [Bdellovibrio bacteriovorus W]|nr:hypothetical protein BDW_03275 [Bdellovibrio bacteriovorus W]
MAEPMAQPADATRHDAVPLKREGAPLSLHKSPPLMRHKKRPCSQGLPMI